MHASTTATHKAGTETPVRKAITHTNSLSPAWYGGTATACGAEPVTEGKWNVPSGNKAGVAMGSWQAVVEGTVVQAEQAKVVVVRQTWGSGNATCVAARQNGENGWRAGRSCSAVAGKCRGVPPNKVAAVGKRQTGWQVQPRRRRQYACR